MTSAAVPALADDADVRYTRRFWVWAHTLPERRPPSLFYRVCGQWITGIGLISPTLAVVFATVVLTIIGKRFLPKEQARRRMMREP